MDQSTANIVVAIITAVVGPVAVVLATQGNVVAAIVIIIVALVSIASLLFLRRHGPGNGEPPKGPKEPVANGPQTGAEGDNHNVDGDYEVPDDRFTVYTVKRGDILFDIAQRFNTTQDVLQRINNLPNPNVLFPGQKLRIPRRSPPDA